MKPAPSAVPEARAPERDDAVERMEVRLGAGDPFGPLDSDDIEWLQERQAERLAKHTRPCAHCGTVFHPVSPYAEECPSVGKHEARCRQASAAERGFYREHRRWPRRGQVDPPEAGSLAEEAA